MPRYYVNFFLLASGTWGTQARRRFPIPRSIATMALSMFSKIFLEITNICDLSCEFCPQTLRKREFLSRERFLLFLDRLAGFGRHLYFHLKGEPLLHPDLGDFLALAEEEGFAITLTTNGTQVAERAPILLGAAKLRKLSISLHSHCGADNVDSYWRGVEAFLDLHKSAAAFPVSLRLWNRGAGQMPPEAARLWELIRARYPAAGEWDSSGAQAKAIKLDNQVFLNQADRFSWPGLALPQGGTRGFCQGLRNQIGILVDGSVVPCCLDGEGAMTLGNILDEDLGKILAGPRARAIHDGFSQRRLVEALCRTCGYVRKFD